MRNLKDHAAFYNQRKQDDTEKKIDYKFAM